MRGADLPDHLVSVGDFNQGGTSKTFSSISEGNPPAAPKNKPHTVSISPEDYIKPTEARENFTLQLEAEQRLANSNGEYLTHEQVFGEPTFNYSDTDLVDVEID
ncbi:type II toxin-antitoxin system Phd/YefM family antitoxin [Bifidobacterium samirii]|uniref:Uncharacterized protein n=1 Tax=Bifidobacterium samirii TaxID=2306974 RepID=A0A430FEZ3_9BIFI|nr:type II toxin-antitoxin system Phd/YefM family antitoxin [Bifidobacterium samirii]RSX51406.1 hypothetical protein D2E24_1872 [Bifidobacterium samirii]